MEQTYDPQKWPQASAAEAKEERPEEGRAEDEKPEDDKHAEAGSGEARSADDPADGIEDAGERAAEAIPPTLPKTPA